MRAIRIVRSFFLWATCSLVFLAGTGGFLNLHVQEINGGTMPIVTFSDADRATAIELVLEERMCGITAHSLATPETRWAWAADRFPMTAVLTAMAISRDSRRISDSDPLPYVGEKVTMGFYSVGDVLLIKGVAPCLSCSVVAIALAFLTGILRLFQGRKIAIPDTPENMATQS